MKHIYGLRRDDAVGFAGLATGWAEACARETGVVRVTVNHVQEDASLFERIGLRVRPLDLHALVHVWCDEADTRSVPAPPPGTTCVKTWRVDERHAWSFEQEWPDGTATPGLKQMSTVAARTDISPDEFVTRYRNHVNVAKVHHIGCWQYVQNFVIDDDPIAGLSELWFRTEADMVERFYTTAGSPDAVRDDTTGFIDFANTRSYLVIETIVRA